MPKKENKKRQITFHNQISSNFREIHVDGAFGGITPRGQINVNFFAERFPIPKSTNYFIEESNLVGDKVKDGEDSKIGVVRQYEFGVYFDLKTAKDIRSFLNDRINELESISINKG